MKEYEMKKRYKIYITEPSKLDIIIDKLKETLSEEDLVELLESRLADILEGKKLGIL